MEGKYTKTQETIARRLKEKREEKKYTLEEAANEIGVSKVTLHRYENLMILNIPSDKIEKLAKLYGTTPRYIMGWEDGDKEEKKENNSPTYKWVARNVNNMDEEQLKKLQGLMKIAFDELYKDEK